jgi:hypothetical protein
MLSYTSDNFSDLILYILRLSVMLLSFTAIVSPGSAEVSVSNAESINGEVIEIRDDSGMTIKVLSFHNNQTLNSYLTIYNSNLNISHEALSLISLGRMVKCYVVEKNSSSILARCQVAFSKASFERSGRYNGMIDDIAVRIGLGQKRDVAP